MTTTTATTATISFSPVTLKSRLLIKPLNYCSTSLYSFRLLSGLKLQGGNRTVTRKATVVEARQGGRHYRRPPGQRRRQGVAGAVDPNYDPALDLERIRSDTVRLLDQEQNMIGVISIDEAIQMAEDAELIMAILSPDADPPVLRLFDINDYQKHKYEQQKKKRDQQKRSAASRVDIKEVKMGYNIDSHDYSVRLRAAKRFLNDGDKVKVIVNLKRRENDFKAKAIELLKRFQSDLGELATEEAKNFSTRDIFMVMMPNKAIIQKTQEQPKKKEESTNEEPATDEAAKEEPAKEIPASI